jgi:hypothetical protein
VRHSELTTWSSSRAWYQAQASFEVAGVSGLLPKKPGPKRSHKLSTEVVDFLEQLQRDEPSLGSADLAERVLERFGRKVHPRSIERALARAKKKPPVACAQPMSTCDFALRYEQMRRSVFERATTGGDFGLVILMREGAAAWMAHASTSSTRSVIEEVREHDRAPVALVIADELRDDMALVLVSMVMTNQEERCA